MPRLLLKYEVFDNEYEDMITKTLWYVEQSIDLLYEHNLLYFMQGKLWFICGYCIFLRLASCNYVDDNDDVEARCISFINRPI